MIPLAPIIQAVPSVLLATYLCGLALATFEGFGIKYLATAAVIGAVSAGFFFYNDKRKMSVRQLSQLSIAALLMLLPVLLSQLTHLQSLTIAEIKTGAAFFLTLATCAAIGTSASRDQLWDAFNLGAVGFFLIVMACLLFGGTSVHDRLDGFDGNMHPNYIGLMAILAACLVFNRGFSYSIPMTMVAVYVCIRASSRASMLAIVAAILTNFACNLRVKRISLANLLIALMGCLVGGAVLVIFYTEISDYVFSKLLLSDDENRGIGTGASGRGDVWMYCLNTWLENPIFGEGYAVTSNRLESPDGGYFLTMAETGAFGLVCVLLFLMRTVVSSVQAELAGPSSPQRCAGLALLAAFAFMNIFESRLQSGANPLSCCAYIICFSNWSGRS